MKRKMNTFTKAVLGTFAEIFLIVGALTIVKYIQKEVSLIVAILLILVAVAIRITTVEE